MKQNRAAVINYCTVDYRFLDLCIRALQPFCEQIIIPVATHFFDGTPEDKELLHRSYAEHRDCQFIQFTFDETKPYGEYCPYQKEDADWSHYWHSTARHIGFQYVHEGIDEVLFIDADEILEENRFSIWLEEFDRSPFSAIRFAAYFYFRSASYRAKTWQSGPLLAKKEKISTKSLFSVLERKGMLYEIEGSNIDYVPGIDTFPLIHHYSWVKTKEELQKKVASWGHKAEKNWKELLEQEFASPFRGHDLLYGMQYDTVPPLHDPLKIDVETIKKHNLYRPIPVKEFVHVHEMDRDSLRRKIVMSLL